MAMPSVWELHYGAAYTESENERCRIRTLMLLSPLVERSEETARRGAKLLAAADRSPGGESGENTEDGLIEAVADRFDEPVLTATVDDFQKLGVDVQT
ncbi:type II toxin-antitoxin system VapC family toxin [Halobium palmae]|uniref:Type II toxin-antitoxin system VapC family toxin n=1 Tax=Halobium palmae TaxID=1776492 RepID=A0ABD5RU73_9EURY